LRGFFKNFVTAGTSGGKKKTQPSGWASFLLGNGFREGAYFAVFFSM
jgi:hypothetical protein